MTLSPMKYPNCWLKSVENIEGQDTITYLERMEISHHSLKSQGELRKKMPNEQIKLSGRLNGHQRNRLKSLLNMFYRPNELAEEIGISKHQIYRVYIPCDCPHQRDELNHIWINGEDFCKWYGD